MRRSDFMRLLGDTTKARLAVLGGLLIAAGFVVSPLFPHNILMTQASDLAHHVRHGYEYTKALQEGQRPPLVTPTLNNSLRLPLFQYYTGTAYVIPGLLGLTGLAPYPCLKATIFLLSWVGALAVFGALRGVRAGRPAAFLGALTFQLYGFAAIDLYNRGGFTEWASLQYGALVLWALIGLGMWFTRPRSRGALVLRSATAVVTLVLFIPCHPVQTLYMGVVIGLLAVAATFDRMPFRRALLAGLLTLAVGMVSILITAWFWLPILSDYTDIRINGHHLYLPTCESLAMLFWPWFRPGNVNLGWAVQLGPHITVASLIVLAHLVGRRRFQVYPVALLGLLTVLVFLTTLPISKDTSPFLQRVYQFIFPSLKPVQFAYRFLIPCALVGAGIVALAADWTRTWLPRPVRTALFVLAVTFLGCWSFPFYHRSQTNPPPHYSIAPEGLLTRDYDSPNAVLSYGFVGNDYLALFRTWVREGHLHLGEEIHLPFEGLPYEAALSFVPSRGGPVRVFANGQEIPTQISGEPGSQRTLRFRVVPGRGSQGRDPRTLRFEADHGPVAVTELRVRPERDTEWIHLPQVATLDLRADQTYMREAVWSVRTPRAGLYQLPFCYYPGVRVTVNGIRVSPLSSDRFLFTTSLPAGTCTVRVEAKPTRLSLFLFWIGTGSFGALGTGICVWGRARRQREKGDRAQAAKGTNCLADSSTASQAA
jgi:hypothetical protein